jgi:Uma2 family endonuclease
LAYDRFRKGSLYARSGISDYWIINLIDNQLEVYRAPVVDPSHPYGFRYQAPTILKPGATISPL